MRTRTHGHTPPPPAEPRSEDPSSADRRGDTRFGVDVLGNARGTLRPGCSVTLVNLSVGGALVEGGRPLRPGARVHLQFHRGTRRFSLAAHVLRCAVWALDRDAGVLYRGALKFDHRCELLWEAETPVGYDGTHAVHHDPSLPGHALPASSPGADRGSTRGPV